ncbi:MAG: alpha/beta hydrolase [Myroides sp.]
MKKIHLILLCSILSILLFSCNGDDENVVIYPVNEDVILENVSYGSHERHKMDVFLPADRNTSKTKILVMIHGGGWIGGDKSDFDAILDRNNIEELKKQFPDIAVFTLNYRLATANTNQYPAAEQDIKSAMDFIFRSANSYQVNANTTYILGGSAGAHLAALYTVKNPSSRLIGTIGISGAYELKSLYTDGNDEARTVLETFLGGTPDTKAENYFNASPFNFVKPATTKFLLLHGTGDELVPISQANKFETELKNKNNNVQTFYYSGGHGIPPEHLGQGIEIITDFLK